MKLYRFEYYLIFFVLFAVFCLYFVSILLRYFSDTEDTKNNEWIPIQIQFEMTMDHGLFCFVSILLVEKLGDLVYCCSVWCHQLARDIIGKMRKQSSVKGLQGQDEKKLKRGKKRKNKKVL